MNKQEIIDELLTFDELTKEQQENAINLAKNEIYHALSDGFPMFPHESEEEKVVNRAMAKAEANRTPWFFLEILRDEKLEDGSTFDDLVRQNATDEAKEIIYHKVGMFHPFSFVELTETSLLGQ